MARRVMRWVLLLLTAALVGCDHATKAVARAALGGRARVDVVPGVLDLRYVENRDTAFSVTRLLPLPHKPIALAVLGTLALAAIAVLWARRRRLASRVEHVAFALLVAGAIGNVVDRVARGFVVDFIELPRWPVFNVADVLVVAGAALLAMAARRRAPST